MGEAKRRKKWQNEQDAWRAGLSERDRLVVRVAERIAEVLPLDGACYRTTMFLKYYLQQAHGIESNAVVGYVNDGTDLAFSYHAWLEVDGRRVDITLGRPLNSEYQKRGRTIILDREMTVGWTYTYHRERSAEALKLMLSLLQRDDTREYLAEADARHRQMITTSASPELTRVFLDSAPDGLTYERLAAMIEPRDVE